MTEPTPLTHDMAGLRAARHAMRPWHPTTDDMTRMENRFRRDNRLYVTVMQSANRHGLDTWGRPGAYGAVNPSTRHGMTIHDDGNHVTVTLDAAGGTVGETAWDRTDRGFAMEADEARRVLNAWVVRGCMPSHG